MFASGHVVSCFSKIAVAAMFGLVVCMEAIGQDRGPGPDGPYGGPGGEFGGPDGGQPQVFDPNNPPVKPTEPVKPIPPKPLELDTSWLDIRERLLDICYGVCDKQFDDVNISKRPTANPLIQRFREYWSEKNIVSEWSIKRPLDIDWSYPIPDTTEKIDEIEKNLEAELTEAAAKAFPRLTPEEYLKEGEKKYSLFKKGDMVEMSLVQGGHGSVLKIRGKLLDVGKDRIRVAPRRIVSRIDMPDEMAARFFRNDHAKMVKKYAATADTDCLNMRSSYIRQQIRLEMPKRLIAANYVPDHVRFGDVYTTKIFKKEQWVSRRAMVLEYQQLMWTFNLGPQNLEKSLTRMFDNSKLGGRAQTAFMSEQGYCFLSDQESVRLGRALRKDEENRHKGWVPQADVNAMRKFLVLQDQYEKDFAQYQIDFKNYQEAMVRYEREKKEFDRKLKEYEAAGGAVGGDDDED